MRMRFAHGTKFARRSGAEQMQRSKRHKAKKQNLLFLHVIR